MADIELITDGIAREIIEANKENNEKLLDEIRKNSNYIEAQGKFKYLGKTFVNRESETTQSCLSVKGRGLIKNIRIKSGRDSSGSFNTSIDFKVDGKNYLTASIGYMLEETIEEGEWIPFEEGFDITLYKGDDSLGDRRAVGRVVMSYILY